MEYINIESQREYTLKFDGGCRPTNPGPTAGAFVIYDNNLNLVAQGAQYIEYGTSNIGEYLGLLIGLQKAVELKIEKLRIIGDSLLVINHVLSIWKVKNLQLKEYHGQIINLLKNIKNYECIQVPRKYNKEADKLCTEIIKDNNKSFYNLD